MKSVLTAVTLGLMLAITGCSDNDNEYSDVSDTHEHGDELHSHDQDDHGHPHLENAEPQAQETEMFYEAPAEENLTEPTKPTHHHDHGDGQNDHQH